MATPEINNNPAENRSQPEFTGEMGADTRFKPGNPGKPRGARHRATQIVEKLFLAESDLEEIAKQVVAAARKGEQWAISAILQRVAPPRRAATVELRLPKIDTAADLVTAMGVVIDALGAGEIDPDQAAVIASILETRRRTIETAELERRLAAIEANHPEEK